MVCKLFITLKRTDNFELKSENEHSFDVYVVVDLMCFNLIKKAFHFNLSSLLYYFSHYIKY